MKYTLFVGIVGLFAASISQAQLTGTLNQVVPSVRPIIDRAPSELKSIREEASRKMQASVDGARDLSILASGVVGNLPAPQFVTPTATTILNASGQKIIKEVRVENGFLAVEKEWLFIGEEADKAYFNGTNIKIQEAQFLPAFSQWLYKVKVTGDEDEVSYIRNSLPKNLQSQIGRNHIYLSQSEVATNGSKPESTHESEASSQKFEFCSIPLRIGMVDTHVVPTHPMLSHISLTQASFIVGQGQKKEHGQDSNLSSEGDGKITRQPATQENTVAFSSEHGTAVASLLAASLPESSQVFNASVFYARNSVSQGATLMSLIEGLNYLASQQVDAINMSLAGPDNPILARVIKQLDTNGIQIIAAVGNEGPASLPLYPAAYPETLGITAVDKSHAIYRWANQGDYVDFAAFGVSVDAAHPNGKTIRQTGTSMASPRAAALYACFFRTEQQRQAALLRMQELALDAGNPGRDRVFGFGVLP
ncbi:peptidase S8 [Alteromonas sp. BL110]|uniref:S8 family serine peptidase n=1 Tax=Alteromonas sp. BL110 TaxID=1714845 RepID=UPI000E4CFA0B|nr:S8 family serine peptidase [Alteromonas sp. BL110]AXT38767.1 peptidase S8 [Alteromonas sp. BL110]RKM83083.1 peptidase S8 [Alteromonas sp. BL110]